MPAVIRWPGVIKPGTTSHSLFAQIDLMATFAALVGYELPGNAAEKNRMSVPLPEERDQISANGSAMCRLPGDIFCGDTDCLSPCCRCGY